MTGRTSVADIKGPWVENAAVCSGLIERCKHYWNTPISELPNLMIATYINQNIATEEMRVEGRRRLNKGQCDHSELYDGQLAEAVAKNQTQQPPNTN
jgi:hypothetical protein